MRAYCVVFVLIYCFMLICANVSIFLFWVKFMLIAPILCLFCSDLVLIYRFMRILCWFARILCIFVLIRGWLIVMCVNMLHVEFCWFYIDFLLIYVDFMLILCWLCVDVCWFVWSLICVEFVELCSYVHVSWFCVVFHWFCADSVDLWMLCWHARIFCFILCLFTLTHADLA